MPCTITYEEVRQYECEDNKKKFGMAVTDERLVTAVACALGRVIKENALEDEVPDYAMKWLAQHAKEDREREAAERQAAEKRREDRAVAQFLKRWRRTRGRR